MKYVLSIAAWICLCLVPNPRTEARVSGHGHERRVTVYPSGESCNDPAGWYEVDSTPSSVTLACWTDSDDDPPPSPDNDDDSPSVAQSE